MKLCLPVWRVIKVYIILGLFLLVALYSTAGFIWPPTGAHYFIMAVWLASTIVFMVLSLTQTFYVIEGHSIIQHRLNKKFVYDCNDMVYINEDWSQKNKTLLFYDKRGISQYLPFDKEAKIYALALAKANNRVSKEEFQSRFPHVKL